MRDDASAVAKSSRESKAAASKSRSGPEITDTVPFPASFAPISFVKRAEECLHRPRTSGATPLYTGQEHAPRTHRRSKPSLERFGGYGT
jgi:hypothetical protein